MGDRGVTIHLIASKREAGVKILAASMPQLVVLLGESDVVRLTVIVYHGEFWDPVEGRTLPSGEPGKHHRLGPAVVQASVLLRPEHCPDHHRPKDNLKDPQKGNHEKQLD